MFNLKKHAQQTSSEQATSIYEKGSLQNLDIQIQDAAKDLQNKSDVDEAKQQAQNPEVKDLTPIYYNDELLRILKSRVKEAIPDISPQEINMLTGQLRGASKITDPQLKAYMDATENKGNSPTDIAAYTAGKAAAEAKWNNELKQQIITTIQNQRKNKPNQTPMILSSVGNKKTILSSTGNKSIGNKKTAQVQNILPVENIGDFIKKFTDIIITGNDQAYNLAQSEVVSNVSDTLEQEAQSAFDTLRNYLGKAEEEQEIAAILIKIYGMIPTQQSSGQNTMENTTTNQPAAQPMPMQPAEPMPIQSGAKSFNLSKYAQQEKMEKTAYTNLGDAYFLYGPTEKRICPKLRGRGGGKAGACDVVSEEICRFHCLDGIVIDDNKTICGEAVFRAHVMDKFSRDYVDADGNLVGGYLNKRFEINRNVPEENKMRLKPGETRKPRPPAWGSTESRMQAMRNKEGQKRDYRPVNDGAPFDWAKDVDQNNVEVSQEERDRREEAMGHQTVQYTKRDQGENDPKLSKKAQSQFGQGGLHQNSLSMPINEIVSRIQKANSVDDLLKLKDMAMNIIGQFEEHASVAQDIAFAAKQHERVFDAIVLRGKQIGIDMNEHFEQYRNSLHESKSSTTNKTAQFRPVETNAPVSVVQKYKNRVDSATKIDDLNQILQLAEKDPEIKLRDEAIEIERLAKIKAAELNRQNPVASGSSSIKEAKNVKPFVQGTQRGYAYGLVDDNGQRIIEKYVHTTDSSQEAIEKAYQEASQGASRLLYTYKHKWQGKQLIPDQSEQLPGNLYSSGKNIKAQKKTFNLKQYKTAQQVIPSEGIADGGEPYTDDEMNLMNRSDLHSFSDLLFAIEDAKTQAELDSIMSAADKIITLPRQWHILHGKVTKKEEEISATRTDPYPREEDQFVMSSGKSFNLKEAKKEKGTTYKGKHFKVNPWAACSKNISKKDEPEKHERCVKKVKSKSKTSFNMKEYKTAQFGFGGFDSDERERNRRRSEDMNEQDEWENLTRRQPVDEPSDNLGLSPEFSDRANTVGDDYIEPEASPLLDEFVSAVMNANTNEEIDKVLNEAMTDKEANLNDHDLDELTDVVVQRRKELLNQQNPQSPHYPEEEKWASSSEDKKKSDVGLAEKQASSTRARLEKALSVLKPEENILARKISVWMIDRLMEAGKSGGVAFNSQWETLLHDARTHFGITYNDFPAVVAKLIVQDQWEESRNQDEKEKFNEKTTFNYSRQNIKQAESDGDSDVCPFCHGHLRKDLKGKKHCSTCGTPEKPTDAIDQYQIPSVRPHGEAIGDFLERSAQTNPAQKIIKPSSGLSDPGIIRKRKPLKMTPEQIQHQKDVEDSAKALALEP